MKDRKLSIVFDLDGTLWDTIPCIPIIWEQVLGRHSDIPFRITEEKSAQLMGNTMEQIGEILFPELSRDERKALIDELGQEEVTYLTEHGAVLYEGVEDTLEVLSQEYDLYIVSNCQDGYVDAFLTAHKLEKYFADIEMSGRTGLDKGENIKLLMSRNNIESAIYVGDTEGDEIAARFANIPFIYAGYGFGYSIYPDAVIDNIRQLPERIKQLSEDQ